MRQQAPTIPAEASAALANVRRIFGKALVAVYLHGSAVAGGLRPQSDVDLIVVAGRPMSDAMRQNLLVELMRISGRHPAPTGGPRCIELMVFEAAALSSLPYPAQAAFVYGEWLRAAFEAGAAAEPVSDPEFTLILAQARREARALFGPPAADILPAIPDDDVRRALRDALPALLGNLEGDERNVLLTLARMWRTATTGDFVSKDAAADWAIPRLPGAVADMLAVARDGYLGRRVDTWDGNGSAVRQTAEVLHRQVAASL